jgi:hypothetical protein
VARQWRGVNPLGGGLAKTMMPLMNAPISRRCGVLLFLASLQVLGACQAGSSVGTAPRAKLVGSVQPSSAGLVTPGASATVAASPAAVAIAKLLKPSANTITLSGTVRLDASQLVAQGGGTLATLGEQSVFSAGDTRLIAQGGGNLIANGGGNLIAQGGGNLIANGGGNLIAQGGGNVIVPGGAASLIAQGGGNLIAQGGGNLIAQGGGNLIAQGGGNYRILSTPGIGTGSVAPDAASLARLASGSLVPAAGMMLGVIDLRDNRFVSLGVNDRGEAVEAVYSNLQGAYTLHVPADLKENLRVVALAPGLQGRTGIYDAVVVGGDANDDPSVNDDTTTLTKYLRVAMRGKLWDILRAQTEQEKDEAARNLVGGDLQRSLLRQLCDNYRAMVTDAGVPSCRSFQAAVLASDTLLAYVRLAEVKPISVYDRRTCRTFTVADKQKTALELMQPLLRETRERLTRRLQEDPQYFIKKAQDPTSYVAIANERFRFPGRSAFVITKPSDWWDLVVEGFFAGIEAEQWLYSFDAFADLYSDEEPDKVRERVLTFFACGAGFGLEMGKVFVFNTDAQVFLKSSLPRLADGDATPCGPETPVPSFSPLIRTKFPCPPASASAAAAQPSPSISPSAL